MPELNFEIFLTFLCSKSFGNSYIQLVVIIIKFRFRDGERETKLKVFCEELS